MVRYRQRRRQLAARRYQRQQARRSAQARRRRLIGIVVGVIAGLIALAGVIWVVVNLADEEGGDDTPVVPTSQVVPTNFSDLPTGPTTGSQSTEKSPATTRGSTTGPATTGSSRTPTKGNP